VTTIRPLVASYFHPAMQGHAGQSASTQPRPEPVTEEPCGARHHGHAADETGQGRDCDALDHAVFLVAALLNTGAEAACFSRCGRASATSISFSADR